MRLLCYACVRSCFVVFFFFQAEDGIRDLVRSRGLGDVYKRQRLHVANQFELQGPPRLLVQEALQDRQEDPQELLRLSLIHI